MMNKYIKIFATASAMLACTFASAQKYPGGVIDKTIAVVGNEMIAISDIEGEIQMMRAQGRASDHSLRCEVLESLLESKLYLMQARLDSLSINMDAAEMELTNRIDQVRTSMGGDEMVEEYFGKDINKLRAEWRQQLQDQSLVQQERQQIAGKVPTMTPIEVKQYLDTVNVEDLPIIPIKYQMSQICIYPDRDAANNAVKERLLSLRERIINGERFATLARLYSEDPGSARRGGELGMASKTVFWPAFSDAAMMLKPGNISQVVETPDGFHIIEVLEKKNDMFNARHILMKPKYTEEDRTNAFRKLDSLRTEISNEAITFELAAQFYSEDPATRTNGGQMADPATGSAYFEIDQIKPADYTAVQDLKEGEISEPLESKDNEGYSMDRPGNTVYKIIRLDKIFPAHPATFETDFTELSNLVQIEKQNQEIKKFLDEKIESTHIWIDKIFEECEFAHPGWSKKIKE